MAARSGVETDVHIRHVTLARPRHLLLRTTVPDELPSCHVGYHGRRSAMVDEDYAADCAHLVGCPRRGTHAVLPGDQSGRYSDATRARVGEIVM